MKKMILVIIFFLSACTTDSAKNNFKNDLNFTNDMSFDEFKAKLKIYVKNSSYPNIDN
jgi:hypothetical protein